VVASQSVLAKLMGCNRRTIVRAIQDLVEGRWIEVRQIGDRGTVNAYVINDRVAWHGPRESLRYSLFSATVILAEDEQPDRSELGQQEPLRKLPRLFPGEQQLPAGDGLPPPSQPFFDGMEPALPALDEPEPDPAMQDELSQLVTGLGNKLRAPDASPPDDATNI
jgi:DNA-binding transcriptional MocR family regulator